MLLGAIADDLTGATDLALMLTREEMPTVQTVGVPEEAMEFGDAQAVVIALKSRTISAADAVWQSVAAARALQAIGIRQLIFKYCSTFDSTPAGNVGPVIEALLDLLDERFTIACPAFPTNKRPSTEGTSSSGIRPGGPSASSTTTPCDVVPTPSRRRSGRTL
jgi:3-dehydrotetronate 4-kinase